MKFKCFAPGQFSCIACETCGHKHRIILRQIVDLTDPPPLLSPSTFWPLPPPLPEAALRGGPNLNHPPLHAGVVGVVPDEGHLVVHMEDISSFEPLPPIPKGPRPPEPILLANVPPPPPGIPPMPSRPCPINPDILDIPILDENWVLIEEIELEIFSDESLALACAGMLMQEMD